MSYHEVRTCRICGSSDLQPILSLGLQALTGVFPSSATEKLTTGPLDLVRCGGPCGLVQLKHSYDKDEMYGTNYGYHSSLNRSMVEHLHGKVKTIINCYAVEQGDLAVDIGSNDSTLLRGYPAGIRLIGVDPTGESFRQYYPSHIELIPKFFSEQAVLDQSGGKKAKVVTSIAMFYDLDAPLEFAAQVREILAEDGVWVCEQSYLPAMVGANAYDTICHEHLEYYGLRQFKWIIDQLDLMIIDVKINKINGGSFSVTMARKDAAYPVADKKIEQLLEDEAIYTGPDIYRVFERAVSDHRRQIREFFAERRARGESVFGYGASTKGNVILQYCGLGPDEIVAIGEVNRMKYGCVTPGTHIPIVPEEQVREQHPDYLMILPWHFKDFIVRKEQEYLRGGGRLFFPLPVPHVVG